MTLGKKMTLGGCLPLPRYINFKHLLLKLNFTWSLLGKRRKFIKDGLGHMTKMDATITSYGENLKKSPEPSHMIL